MLAPQVVLTTIPYAFARATTPSHSWPMLYCDRSGTVGVAADDVVAATSAVIDIRSALLLFTSFIGESIPIPVVAQDFCRYTLCWNALRTKPSVTEHIEQNSATETSNIFALSIINQPIGPKKHKQSKN
jgi:hypothetical protein